MKRRVLLIEPDDTARMLMGRVLGAEGLRVVGARSLTDAGAEDEFDVAIVDELAGNGAMLDEVKRVQRRHPSLPLVVTGALMTPAVLVDVLRLGAADALPKPFAPAELRAAVARVFARSSAGHDRAVEFAAAIGEARDAIARGAPGAARASLRAAHAASVLDAEAMALEALVAELEGRDDDADRAYRAALALEREVDGPPPRPADGLARLKLYEGAPPVPRLPTEFAGAPAWIAADPSDLEALPPARESATGREVLVVLLGVSPDAKATYFRAGRHRALVLVAASGRSEAIAAALDRTNVGKLSEPPAPTSPLDLERIERLRAPNIGSPKAAGS